MIIKLEETQQTISNSPPHGPIDSAVKEVSKVTGGFCWSLGWTLWTSLVTAEFRCFLAVVWMRLLCVCPNVFECAKIARWQHCNADNNFKRVLWPTIIKCCQYRWVRVWRLNKCVTCRIEFPSRCWENGEKLWGLLLCRTLWFVLPRRWLNYTRSAHDDLLRPVAACCASH